MDDTVVNIFKNAINGQFKEVSQPLMRKEGSDISGSIKNIKDVNMQDQYGTTLLMVAAYYGHTSVMEALLENGANPQIKNEEGMTAFDIAKTEGHEESVRAISQWLPSLRLIDDQEVFVGPEKTAKTTRKPGPRM